MAERAYENDAIRVRWRSELCVHVGRCLRGLPSVFDLQSRPWVDIDGASAEEIAATVEACPSGALTYERLDGVAGEQTIRPARAMPARNGPLVIRGDIRLCDPDGSEVARETRVTLCRCGKSENQPFCDNSHRRAGFRADSEPFGEKSPVAEGDSGPLRVTPRRDASLRVEGPLVVVDARGAELGRGTELSFCRCGHSGRKPLCDKSHERVGFRSTEPCVAATREAAQSPAAFEENRQI